MDCPKLTCDNPLPLASGDCCPRCPNDPCSYAGGNVTSTALAATGLPCTYQGQLYESGQTFSDPSSQCSTCGCKVNQEISISMQYTDDTSIGSVG